MASGRYSDACLAFLERKDKQVEIRKGSERTTLYRLLCVNRKTVNMTQCSECVQGRNAAFSICTMGNHAAVQGTPHLSKS